MATITDTLLTLAQDIRDAIAAVRGIEARVKAAVDTNAGTVTTIINNFNARPLQVAMYVDEVGGNDANDGLSIGAPKKSLDNLLINVGSQGVSIALLSDALIRRRHTLFTNVTFAGIQPANNAVGAINVYRTISFLGTAVNSPDPFVGTNSAGFFFTAGSLTTQFVNFSLPIVPGDLTTRAHIVSRAFVDVLLLSPTITVAGAGAAALFGSFAQGRLSATLSPVLGTGAAGHLFEGIGAGNDPNVSWSYNTSVKSA